MDAGLVLVWLVVVAVGGLISRTVIRWMRQVDWTAPN